MTKKMEKIMLIFGATGDLMDKKISPALFALHSQKPDFVDHIFGIGRKPLSKNDFHTKILNSASKKIKVKNYEKLCSKIDYIKVNFSLKNGFDLIKEKIISISEKYSLFIYFAVPSTLYQNLIEKLSEASLINKNTYLMIEKPIGKNLESSIKIEKVFEKYFSQKQIFRIDHYLGKKSIKQIIDFRFNSDKFEPFWSKKYIDKIHITTNEFIGVEKRGKFYDELGALRDVGQNHLLEILAIICMDKPKCDSVSCMQESREEIMKSLNSNIKKFVRGQYKGYLNIPNVKANSKTETYFKIQTDLLLPRWENVSIILESGKRLSKTIKKAVITFKDKNKLVFEINNKNVQYVEEYKNLILDFLNQNQNFFVSKNEVFESWKFIDSTIKKWIKKPLVIYEPNKLSTLNFN